MAHVLPQAPPAKASLANLKVPAASVPLKPHSPEPAAAKTKFQTLMDQLSQAVKLPSDAGEKGKATKVKVEVPEKAKEPRKAEAKEPKTDAPTLAWAVVTPPQAKVAPVPAKTSEGEALSANLDKAKSAVRDKKTGAELAVPAPVTAAATEVARSQAQQTLSRSERSEEKPKVFVVDKRTDAKEKEKLKLPGAEAPAQQPVAAAEFQAQQTKTSDAKVPTEVQVSFQTVSGKAREGFDLKAQTTPVSPRDAATFQQYLIDRGYGQLVDQARIVLKDQNAGEIRMTLYPESLGKVKVALNLTDNSLAGQIFVENQTVKDVFQSNLDGLMQAFREGGWDQMSLEVSVGNGDTGNPSGQRPDSAPVPARDYGRQIAQTGPVETGASRIGSWNDRQINLTA